MALNRNKQNHLKNISLTAWEVFLSNVDEETRDVYSRAMRFFLEANHFTSLEEAAAQADEENLFTFIRFLKDRKSSVNTVRLYVAGVRRFFEAVKRPLNSFDLKLAIPKRRPTRETNAIPAELIRDIILAAPPSKKILFHFLWATGLRIGEALSLRKKDFDLTKDPARFTVITEKTGRPRTVFIPVDLRQRLVEHLDRLREDDFVFHVEDDPKKPLNSNKVGEGFRRVLFKLGLLKKDASGRGYIYTLHSFRRSYETQLATSGVHPMVIKYMVGHTQSVEDSYLRLAEADLEREWRKAEPALRLDLKQPMDQEYVKLLEKKLEAMSARMQVLEMYLKALTGEELDKVTAFIPKLGGGELRTYDKSGGISVEELRNKARPGVGSP